MAESRGWWDKGVRVILRDAGTQTVVNNSQQAAEVLLYRWPERKAGPKHLEARRSVMKAMENALDRQRQADARKAFEEAASEAGISLE